MAPPYESPQPGDPIENISFEKARQGRNVEGMIWAAFGSIGLVAAAYAFMLALQAKPVGVDDRGADDPAAITLTGPTGADVLTPETAKSPT